MTTTYRGEGLRIRYSNSGSAISSGDIVDIGGFIGVAVDDIAATSGTGALDITGEHSLTCASADVIGVGERLFYDSNAEALTLDPGRDGVRTGNTPAGVAVTAAGDGTTTVKVRLIPAGFQPEFIDFLWEDVAADKTLDAEDVGKVINVTGSDKTITLPATAVNLKFVVRVGTADAAGSTGLSVDPNAADQLLGADLTGTADKDLINTAATSKQGDFVELLGEGTDGYYVTRQRGTWAEESA